MFPPHDAVNDALLRRVEEAEHGDDAGNLRLCERGFRGVRVVVGGVVRSGVFRGSGRGIADGWRRRPLARFARDGGGRLDGRGGGEDLASGVPSSASWLSRRVVVVPRTKVSLSAAKAAHRRRRSSSDTERQRESSKLSSTIGTSTRRVGSSGAAILWSGGGRSGISQQKRSKNLGREDEQTHSLKTHSSPEKGRFRHALRDSRSSPRAPAGCEACPPNERGAGPLVEMPWFCPGHRVCDPTSNAPSAGEPASSACRPMFTPRIALTP